MFNDKWMLFNDEIVNGINKNSIKNNNIYLLCYLKFDKESKIKDKEAIKNIINSVIIKM